MARDHGEDLRQLPVFAALSRKSQAMARGLVTPIDFESGHILCAQGQIGREAFVIVEGTASVSVDGDIVATVGPGAVVGELALLGELYRTATVTAVGPVKALVMSVREFESVMALPGVGDEIRRVAAARAADLEAE